MKRVYSAVLTVFLAMQCLSAQAIGLSSFTEKLPSVASLRLPWNNPGFEANGEYNTEGIGLASWTGNKVTDGFDAVETMSKSFITNNWRKVYQVPVGIGFSVAAFSKRYPLLMSTVIGCTLVYLKHYYDIDVLADRIARYETYGLGEGENSPDNFTFACWKLNVWKTGKDLLSNKDAVWSQLQRDVNSNGRVFVCDEQGDYLKAGHIESVQILHAIRQEQLEFERDLSYLSTFTNFPNNIIQECGSTTDSLASAVDYCNKLDNFAQFERSIKEKFKGSWKQSLFYQSTWRCPWKFRLFTCYELASQVYWNVYKNYARLRALVSIVDEKVSAEAPKSPTQILRAALLNLKRQAEKYKNSEYWLPQKSRDKVVLLSHMSVTVNSLVKEYRASQKDTPDTLGKIKDHLALLERVPDPNWDEAQKNFFEREHLEITGEIIGYIDELLRKI